MGPHRDLFIPPAGRLGPNRKLTPAAVLRPFAPLGSGDSLKMLEVRAPELAPDLGKHRRGRGWDRTSGLCCVSAEPGVPTTCGDLRFRS
jgi:hypothetical protein